VLKQSFWKKLHRGELSACAGRRIHLDTISEANDAALADALASKVSEAETMAKPVQTGTGLLLLAL